MAFMVICKKFKDLYVACTHAILQQVWLFFFFLVMKLDLQDLLDITGVTVEFTRTESIWPSWEAEHRDSAPVTAGGESRLCEDSEMMQIHLSFSKLEFGS